MKRAMRIAGAFALAFGLTLGAGSSATAQGALSAEDLDDLQRVNQYLNELGFLTGRFVQISDTGGGYAEGTFYMAERTRLRFEYDPPHQLTFLSDGNFVGMDNAELGTTSQFPIGATPLRVLLRRDVDLTADANITAVERVPGQLRVVATEDDGLAQGELTLIFSNPGLELRQWVIVDAQGHRTTVALQEVHEVETLSDDLFAFPDYSDERDDFFD